MADINYFVIMDYVIFGVIVLISLAVGLYHSRKQKNLDEYIHGSHNMKLLPVSISLFVSFVSAMTMQGIPAEVYIHGLGVSVAMFALWGILLSAITFLPIYYYMKPTSIYQYLEVRYGSRKPKVLATLLSMCSKIVYCGLVIYGPSAALESFSGIPTHYNVIMMLVICTIYTSMGGLRGVIMTDVFQAIVIVLGFSTIIILGIYHLGFSTIWFELEKYDRTQLDFDPTIRNSFWISLVCIGIQWFVLFSSQTAMMRYTSLPTKKQAVISVILGGFGCVFLIVLAVGVGAIVFAHYAKTGCGPLASGKIVSSNQVVPYYVFTELKYPGIPGLYLAAIFASSLSSVSSLQSAVVAMLWNDILSPVLPKLKDWKETAIIKVLVILIGVLAAIIALVAQHTGETLYNLGFLVIDVLLSPVFGMFILGAAFPFAGSIGAQVGCFVSAVLCLWISVGKMMHGTNWVKPVLIDNMCYNETILNVTTQYTRNITDVLTYSYNGTSDMEENHISSYANPTIALTTTILVGLLISVIPAFRNKQDLDANWLFPFVKSLLQSKRRNTYKLNETSINKTKEKEKTLL